MLFDYDISVKHVDDDIIVEAVGNDFRMLLS